MKKLIIVLLSFIISTGFVVAESQTLRMHGSNTIGANLAPELVLSWLSSKGYHVVSNKITAKEERKITAVKQDDKLVVEIYAHGSSTSFRALAAGKADIGMSSRPIKDKEVKSLQLLGSFRSKKSEYIIALDGLPIIVHKTNPLKKLSKDKVKDIFSGKINNWSQLGLAPAKINVYSRDNNSGTYDTFKSLVLGKKTPLKYNAKRFESNKILSNEVANDPNGIGFVGIAYIGNAKAVAISDTGTRALIPEAFTVATEDYALSRRLYMYLPEVDVHPLAKEFIKYAISAAADDIVKKIGFISQEIDSYRIGISPKAPIGYRQLTYGASRLSLNVRFKSGSIKLDNKAVRNIERLAEYFKLPENKYRKLLLFGFSDKNEVIPYVSNAFSVYRADSVADYLAKFNIHPIRIRGYGHTLPVANNDSQQGRFKNRRVEIWMM